MRRFWGVLLVVCSLSRLPLSVFGEGLQMELLTEQLEFLPNEPLHVGLRIQNRSGQPVVLGQANDWIRFAVFDVEKHLVLKRSDPPPGEVFVLPNGQEVIKSFNLAPHFDLSTPGSFVITAQVNVRQWNETLPVNARRIDVVRGIKLATLVQGVADPEAPNAPPQMRTYTLQQKRNAGRQQLYLRVAAEDGFEVFNVLPVGSVVPFGRPEMHVDRRGAVHLLFQNGAREYLYCNADAQGAMVRRHSYQVYQSRPKLRVDERGNLEVVGGRRTPSAMDWPVTKLPQRTSILP